MSNVIALLKIEFTRSFSSLFKSNKKKARTIPFISIILITCLVIMAFSVGYSILMIMALNQIGVDLSPIVIMFASLASFLIFASSMGQARSIYIGDDYDLLTSLPIKKSEIVASKVINLFSVELLFSLLIMIPNGLTLLIMGHSLPLFLVDLMLAFLLPIVPIAMACLISLALTILTARYKFGNFIYVGLFLLFNVAIAFISIFTLRGNPAAQASSLTTMSEIIKWINPSLLLIQTYFPMMLLIYVGVSLVVGVLIILFLTLLFDHLHDLVTSISMKSVYHRKDLKIKNEFKALAGIELKRYFSSKMYFMNTVMGAIMGIVSLVIMIVSFAPHIDKPEIQFLIYYFATPACITLIIFVFGISNASCSAISIEGKNFWIIKTLPINYKKYMLTKLINTLIIFIPASLIASSILVGFVHFDAFSIIAAYLIPLIFVFMSAALGLIINLKKPKLKWKNEVEVVKNSAAALLTMIFDFFISIVLGGAMIGLTFVNLYLALGVGLGLVSLITIIFYLYLNHTFVKSINAIEDL